VSKFIDRLRQASGAVAQPIGFGRGKPVSPEPKILLVASLARADIGNVADLVAGADAGLLNISGSAGDSKTLKQCVAEVPDIPWGGRLKSFAQRQGRQVKASGCDFIVFPAKMPLGVLEDTGAGRILELEATLDGGLLRTVDELPVDGVLISVKKEDGLSVTWQQLMLFQRASRLLTKPLLVPVPPEVTAVELRMLWEAGVDGVILEIGDGRPRGGLGKLREALNKLTFPSRMGRGKVRALLPKISEEAEVEDEEELPSDS
jgi:hypothetical protein